MSGGNGSDVPGRGFVWPGEDTPPLHHGPPTFFEDPDYGLPPYEGDKPPKGRVKGFHLLKPLWQSVGPRAPFYPSSNAPVSGRILAMAISPAIGKPSKPGLFISIDGGGVWRSVDFTSPAPQWTPLVNDLSFAPIGRRPGLLQVGALTVDPNHPETIYAGTGSPAGLLVVEPGNGLLKSENGGETWKLLSLFQPETNLADNLIPGVTSIVVDPGDSNTIYIAGGPRMNKMLGRGVFRSTNGGATWSAFQDGLPDGNVEALDFVRYKPANGPARTVLFLAIRNPLIHIPPSAIYRYDTSMDSQWKPTACLLLQEKPIVYLGWAHRIGNEARRQQC